MGQTGIDILTEPAIFKFPKFLWVFLHLGGILYTLPIKPECPKNHSGQKKTTWAAQLTVLAVGIAHVVGCPISLVVGMSCGPVHCNKLAPVHLQTPKDFQSVQNFTKSLSCGSLRKKSRFYSLLIMWDLHSSLDSACSP